MAIDLGKFDERFFEDQLKLDDPEETNVNFIEAREKRQVIERLLFDRTDGVKGRFDQIMAECDPLPGTDEGVYLQRVECREQQGSGPTIGSMCDKFKGNEELGEVTLGLHYAAYIKDELDKEPFDYSYSRNTNRPEQFYMDNGTLLPGLELALRELCKGDQAKIVCAPRWAYGPHGCPPRIPPQSWIIFNVKVVSTQDTFFDFISENVNSSKTPGQAGQNFEIC